MRINSLIQSSRPRIASVKFYAPGMTLAAITALAALFLFSGPSFAQGAAKQKSSMGRESSVPSVSEGVASNPSSGSATKTAKASAAPAAPAVPHAPAVAYLLLQSAQGPVNGGSTDPMHRNWIAVSEVDKGSLADGAAKGQASESMDNESSKGGVNPLYEQKDAMARKVSGDGAAKGQATEGVVRDKNISDGAAKSQAVDTVAQNPNSSSESGNTQSAAVDESKNISDGAAKGQAKDAMDKKGSGDGTGNTQSAAGIADDKNISDGAAKGQAQDAMDHKNTSDGAAKGQASDATAPGFPALDAASKDAAKMSSASGSSSGSFTIQKEIDQSSPILKMAAASGRHFSSAQIDVLDGGVWRHYQLSDVTVSSVQSSGGGERPSESISLTFSKIKWK